MKQELSLGHTFLLTDFGKSLSIAVVGNLCRMIRRIYRVLRGACVLQGPAARLRSVVEALCTPDDLLADRVALPDSELGKLVISLHSVWYGATGSPGAFPGRRPTRRVLV